MQSKLPCSAPSTPSASRPFFFFHVPKVGGSTFEELLDASVRRLSSPPLRLITCTNHTPCWWHESIRANQSCTFSAAAQYGPILCDYPAHACSAAMFAGHFTPSVVGQLAELSGCSSRRWPHGQPEYDCVIFLRHPLERVISAYDFLQRLRNSPARFSKLSFAEQKRVVLEAASPHDNITSVPGASMPQHNGILAKKDAVRIVQASHNMTMVDFLASGTSLTAHGGRATALSPKRKLSLAKASLDQCVVGITEQTPASYRLIASVFPWLLAMKPPKAHKLRSDVPADAKANLTSYVVGELTRFLNIDMKLYEYGIRRFQQLRRMCMNTSKPVNESMMRFV